MTKMELAGRMAECSCGKSVPSDSDLPFFQYRGPGSYYALTTCARCRFSFCAHVRDESRVQQSSVVERGECIGFTPAGPDEHDLFYCGCRGLD